MTADQLLGLGILLLGAICGGSFGLPSKYVKSDTPWEVLWGPFFFFVTILIPCAVAPLVVNDLGGVYTSVDTKMIIGTLVFGFLWGLGSMTLGMSFSFIGLSLAYAINYGAQIACGFTLPMLLFNADQFLTTHGAVILAGVAVCLVGVVACGRAGILKERDLASVTPDDSDAPTEETAAKKNPKMIIGLVIAFLSGILCACYAVASSFAGPIGGAAVDAGNPQWAAAWASTAMILWGGAISACLYCVVQLTKNKTWAHLTQPGIAWILLMAALMAILHDAAIFLFGLGWMRLGDLGVPVGYPIFMSFAIMVGNFHGFRTGEWKGASRTSVTWIVVGIAILVLGVCLLAQGIAMQG